MNDFNLFETLSSTAKLKIAQAMVSHPLPVSIRQLESLTRLPIRSVQIALEPLVKDKIILKSKKGRNVLCELNPQHPAYSLIQKIFEFITRAQLNFAAKQYENKAKEVLKFTDEMLALQRRADMR